MARRTSPERQSVIDLLGDVEEATPAEVATALDRSPGSTRQLLGGMIEDGLVITRSRGRYRLPPDEEADNLTRQPDTLTQNPDAPDVNPDVPESRTDKLRPGQIFAFSVRDGGMIPNEVLRERKGY